LGSRCKGLDTLQNQDSALIEDRQGEARRVELVRSRDGEEVVTTRSAKHD